MPPGVAGPAVAPGPPRGPKRLEEPLGHRPPPPRPSDTTEQGQLARLLCSVPQVPTRRLPSAPRPRPFPASPRESHSAHKDTRALLATAPPHTRPYLVDEEHLGPHVYPHAGHSPDGSIHTCREAGRTHQASLGDTGDPATAHSPGGSTPGNLDTQGRPHPLQDPQARTWAGGTGQNADTSTWVHAPPSAEIKTQERGAGPSHQGTAPPCERSEQLASTSSPVSCVP